MYPAETEKWHEAHYLGEIQMIRISNRMLGIMAAVTVFGGTALGVAVTAGTAHAQASASLSLTSSTIDQMPNGNYYPVLTFAVTCPVGYDVELFATVSQGVTYTGNAGYSNPQIACTGNAQTVNVSAQTTLATVVTPTESVSEPQVLAAGPAFVGATLALRTFAQPQTAPPASLAEITTLG
jgi:hypothetical protein